MASPTGKSGKALTWDVTVTHTLVEFYRAYTPLLVHASTCMYDSTHT